MPRPPSPRFLLVVALFIAPLLASCAVTRREVRQARFDEATVEAAPDSPADDQRPLGVAFESAPIRFEPGRAALTPEARAALDGFVQRLSGQPGGYSLEVQGHTDGSRSEASNQRLAGRRAETVRDYLHRLGVPLARMEVLALHANFPAVAGDTPEARASNRRVMVLVLR